MYMFARHRINTTTRTQSNQVVKWEKEEVGEHDWLGKDMWPNQSEQFDYFFRMHVVQSWVLRLKVGQSDSLISLNLLGLHYKTP